MRASACSSAMRRILVSSRRAPSVSAPFRLTSVATMRILPLFGHVHGVAGAPSCRAEMRRNVPPHLYFVVSAVFHYLGPAFAVLLFARVQVLGVAWLRIASAAVIFATWRRPWRAFKLQDRDGKRLLVAWGTVLAVMNACFYTAID